MTFIAMLNLDQKTKVDLQATLCQLYILISILTHQTNTKGLNATLQALNAMQDCSDLLTRVRIKFALHLVFTKNACIQNVKFDRLNS